MQPRNPRPPILGPRATTRERTSSWPAQLALGLALATVAACGEDGGSQVPDANRPIDAAKLIDAASGPTRAVAYINRDTGMPTENSDVDMGSGCAAPDVSDTQVNSDTGMTNRNVHIDACLFGAGGDMLDGQATFESSGVGSISACPDPDAIMGGANGPKTATSTDTDGDMRKDRCVQSGYQTKGTPGDNEFHARFNNDAGAGTQTVIFCFDASGDGCADETPKTTVTITWTE